MIPLQFEMRLETVTGMNVRECKYGRARRVKAERATTDGHLAMQGLARRNEIRASLPLLISLTRMSPKAKWLPDKRIFEACDDDAVPPALKGVRDEIAKWLGMDDGDQRLFFKYAQEKGPMGVRVRIEEREAMP
jgi:hypothetical protein